MGAVPVATGMNVPALVVPTAASSTDLSTLFLEFGLLILGLGIIARLARRWEMSAVPFYLIAGLLVGEGGLGAVDASDTLVPTLAELGVILLLLLLGLEYSGDELVQTAQRQSRSGLIDLVRIRYPAHSWDSLSAGAFPAHWRWPALPISRRRASSPK